MKKFSRIFESKIDNLPSIEELKDIINIIEEDLELTAEDDICFETDNSGSYYICDDPNDESSIESMIKDGIDFSFEISLETILKSNETNNYIEINGNRIFRKASIRSFLDENISLFNKIKQLNGKFGTQGFEISHDGFDIDYDTNQLKISINRI